MLTPERIKQFDEITGLNAPTSTVSNVGKSRANEIRAKYATSSTGVETPSNDIKIGGKTVVGGFASYFYIS